MATKVNIPSEALKNIKHLKRKYPAVTDEIRKLVEQLENDERPGDKIPHVNYDVYKVRLPNPSARKGKSGGFRVIYYCTTCGHRISTDRLFKNGTDRHQPRENSPLVRKHSTPTDEE